METKVVITRTSHERKQTLGTLTVLQDDKPVYSCKTLELPWLDNAPRISCIPTGSYKVLRRTSAKYGPHFHVQNVPNRDLILIHHGNYHTDILGCILVGQLHADINNDGCRDVTSSKATMTLILRILPAQFTLTIK